LQNSKFDLPLKVGLLLATLSWFSWVFFDFNIGIFNRHITFPTIIEDIPGVWGVGFRMAAAAILIIIVVLFVIRREFSRPEATTAFRFVLLFEAFYFAGFLGGALNGWKRNYFTLPRILEQGLPCFVIGILIPVVLIKLFFELNPSKPKKGAVKWALIYVTAFLFVFWLNNMGYWVAAVLAKGVDYITQYPINLLSFAVTIVGLLLLFLYAADFSSKWLRIGTLEKLDLRRVGVVVTLLGLYPLFILLLWLFFGSVGGWGTWYAWFLGHGYMTFIALPLPFISLPLLFRSRIKSEDAKLGAGKRKMLNLDRKQLTSLLFLTQALGIGFFTIFSLAYYIPFPSTQVLTGTEPFLSLLRIFGSLFFIFTLVLTALSFRTKITYKTPQ
jgi:hypothetical protein